MGSAARRSHISALTGEHGATSSFPHRLQLAWLQLCTKAIDSGVLTKTSPVDASRNYAIPADNPFVGASGAITDKKCTQRSIETVAERIAALMVGEPGGLIDRKKRRGASDIGDVRVIGHGVGS